MSSTVAEERVSILRRLREMLLRQREKFQGYLDSLEREESAIAGGDVERLQAQLTYEREVVAEIRALAKVIRPLEDLYQAAYPEREDTVPALQAALRKMGARVQERSARNRAALKAKMEDLRMEISGLRAWPRPRSPFREVTPTLIDITT
jgi:DNA repair exonuclease SbcCD ATPase subunit